MRTMCWLLAVAWLLIACTNESTPTAVVFDVEARDVAFEPTALSVPAGAAVTVNLTNKGMLQHDWVVVPATIDPATATVADAANQADSGMVTGGQNTTVTFTAPAAGDYHFLCTVPGHAAAGMVGTFTVTP